MTLHKQWPCTTPRPSLAHAVSLSFTLPLRSPYFIYTGSARLVSVCCNFICRLLLRTRPASRLLHPHATPLHLHNHGFLPPFYTHLLYMIRVDSDKCICVNICGLLCILGLLFWRAGLRITLPLSVTSTSWLDTRTAISSTSFSHSGTLHLEPLQERHRCWTTTAELMSRLCLSAKSHCSLMPYTHPPPETPGLLDTSGIQNQISCSSTTARQIFTNQASNCQNCKQ